MIQDKIKEFNIPEIKDFFEKSNVKDPKTGRHLMLDMLLREEYGYPPPIPDKISYEKISIDENYCAGKAVYEIYMLTSYINDGDSFAFPVRIVRPNDDIKHPVFVHINFRPDIPDKYQPSEEIIDNGYAVVSFCYKEVTSDDNDFSTGLSGIIYKGKDRGDSDCGKIAMWSWAASRVIDMITDMDIFDNDNMFVAGHSRLGKTSLLTAALDERVKCAFVNGSGCSGDAVSRGSKGETVKDITGSFPYWFCKNYYKYVDNEDKLPFDQHFLIAAVAPRYVLISSAEKDLWADPNNAYLSCVMASYMWNLYGLAGFICEAGHPYTGCFYAGGNIAYSMRSGTHYQSRDDWHRYFEFAKIIMNS